MSGVSPLVFGLSTLDSRQVFKKVLFADFFLKKYFKTIPENALIEYWEQTIPVEACVLSASTIQFLCTTTTALSNTQIIDVHSTGYFFFFLHLKNTTGALYFLQDFFLYEGDLVRSGLVTASCYYTFNNLNITTKYNPQEPLFSLSGVYRSFVWVERELKEFALCTFVGLLDTRRLLTDYLTLGNNKGEDYKTTSYDILSQNLYIKLLHWLYVLAYVLFIVILSFIVTNNNLISLILLGELIILIVFLALLLLASLLNVYYLIGIAFLFLVLGGLELALNLLLLII